MFGKLINCRKAKLKTVYDSYRYLYLVLFICGCYTFQLNGIGKIHTTWRIRYSAYAIRFSYLLVFISGLLLKRSDQEQSDAMFGRLTPVIKVVLSWECLSSIVTYLVCCILSDFKRQRHVQLLYKMQKLDDDILTEFCHVRWNYEKTHAKYTPTTVILYIAFVTFSIFFIFSFANCACGYVSSLFIAVSYAGLTTTIGTISFVHIAHIDYLRLRYRLLQKLLTQLYGEVEAVAATSDKSPNLLLHERICSIFEYTRRCAALTLEVNCIFRILAASGTFYCFGIMTCFIFVVCEKIINGDRSVVGYLFILLLLTIYTYKVLIMCIYGHILQKERRNCHHVLSNYNDHFYHIESVRSIVEEFHHWKMHNENEYNVTVGTALRLNLNVTYVIINAIVNYVLILIQLLFQQFNIERILRQHQMPQDVELIVKKTS